MIRNLQRFLLKPNSILTETTLVSNSNSILSGNSWTSCLDDKTSNGTCLGMLKFPTFQLENFSVLQRQISKSESIHFRFL